MRAPRHRFSDEVRSTTRVMAERMVGEGTIPGTPEELDQWIARTPDVAQSLEKGGRGVAFTSHDLFPLLQVFVAKAGGPAPEVEAPPRPKRLRALFAIVVFLAIVILTIVVASDVFP